jgi:hypothetical protein
MILLDDGTLITGYVLRLERGKRVMSLWQHNEDNVLGPSADALRVFKPVPAMSDEKFAAVAQSS